MASAAIARASGIACTVPMPPASGAIASIRCNCQHQVCMRSAPVVALLSFQEPVARSSARMFPRQRPSSACVATFKMAPRRRSTVRPLVSLVPHGRGVAILEHIIVPLRQRAETVLVPGDLMFHDPRLHRLMLTFTGNAARQRKA